MKRHHNITISYFSFLFILVIVIVSCTHQPPRVNRSGLPQREYSYRIPEKFADGWETSSLEEEGVNLEKIAKLIEDILNEKYKNVHSVLLVANGKLILEEYFYDFHLERPHQIRSATKSIS